MRLFHNQLKDSCGTFKEIIWIIPPKMAAAEDLSHTLRCVQPQLYTSAKLIVPVLPEPMLNYANRLLAVVILKIFNRESE